MPSHTLPPGRRLQNYEIRHVLGEGGFAVTYQAWDVVLAQWFAIKEYLPLSWATRSADSADVVVRSDVPDAQAQFDAGKERLLAEARLLAQLASPGIVRVREWLALNGTVYLVMPYEDGESLAAYLHRVKTLPEAELRSYLLPLLAALRQVHAAGWLHGDVTPANLLLRKASDPALAGPGPLLLDFGSARPLASPPGDAPLRWVSDGYAAPEQYQPGAGLGAYTDLYSVGATLYCCITGQSPPAAPRRQACLADAASDPVIALRASFAKRYSPLLLEAVDALLALDPAQRPQTVDALLALLGEPVGPLAAKTRALSEAEKGFTAPQPAAPPVNPIQPRRADRMVGVLAVTLLLVGGLLYYGVRWYAPADRAFIVSADEPAVETSPEPSVSTPQQPPAKPPDHWVHIPGGRFRMGSQHGAPESAPLHWVTVKPFYLARYPLTRGEFAAFVAATGFQTAAERHAGSLTGCYAYREPGVFGWRADASWRDPGFTQTDRDPVVCISWHDAQAYLAWYRTTTGWPVRLPSEAEWEFVAHAGGTATPHSANPFAGCDVANLADQSAQAALGDAVTLPCADGYRFTSPVDAFPAQAFSLYDLIGNVWEWQADCWNASYHGAPNDASPWLQGDCQQRVLRGGSWSTTPDRLGVVVRGKALGDFRSSSHGVRLALDSP